MFLRMKARIRGLLDRRRAMKETDEELLFHIEMETRMNIQAGMSPEEARRVALRDLGGIEQTREAVRRVRSTFLDSIRQDLVFTLRLMRRSPVVTLFVVLSLSLGIGANTAIFSIVESLMLRKLPVLEPDRLVLVADNDTMVWSYPVWEAINDQARHFEGLFAWQPDRMNIAESNQAEFVEGLFASSSFFEVLGVPAVLGRTFTATDDPLKGGSDGAVAVVSHRFWQQRFDGTVDIIGRTLRIERVPFTIIGVTPPSFFGPEIGRSFDVIIPISAEPRIHGSESLVNDPRGHWLSIMARLEPGQTIDVALAGLHSVQPLIREATRPTDWPAERQSEYLRQPWSLIPAATGPSSIRADLQQPLRVMMAVVALLLLIACANVGNLLLARSTTRRHEQSIRLALGASRAQLVRQHLVESLMLSGLGALLGLIFASWGSRLLIHQLTNATATVFLDLSIDIPMLGFTAAVAIGIALLFGVLPALHATRVRGSEALKEGGRVLSQTRQTRLGNLYVVTQVAFSLALVVAAGFFIRTFSNLMTLDLGFEQDRLLVLDIDARNSPVVPSYRPDVSERIRRAADMVPGVARAAVGIKTPTSPGGIWMLGIEFVNGQPIQDEYRYLYSNYISPDWFAAYGTHITAGRDFNDSDGISGPAVAIVNDTFVRLFLDRASPLGRKIISHGLSIEIVGVVQDVFYRSLREPATPMVYLPLAALNKESYSHHHPPPLSVCVRAESGSPARLTESVVTAIGQIDPDFTLTVRPLTDFINARLVQERLLAILSGFFGVLALLLAGIGVFGTTSYMVARRRNEVGIRIAVGATPGRMVLMVLQHVALLLGTGVVLGSALCLWAVRFAEVMLFGFGPYDPVTFVTAAGTLITVGMVAAWLPARRVSRIDPKTALTEGYG